MSVNRARTEVGKGATMKTIIINQYRHPETFKMLQDAMTDGIKVEGNCVAWYYEYTTAGETFGLFTLRDAGDEAHYFGH